MFGFLGPNGSGKTTTIRMLLGLLTPDDGEVELLGEPMPDRASLVLPQVGALIEGPAFYPWLTGRQNLARIDAAGPDGRRSTRRARIDDALARVGLTAAADKRFKAYSLGMRQRLGLANALLRPRQLLILDEPTNGMDPQGTREIRHLIRDLAADGTTVFLSSHLLAEIEQVCTHVAVMSLGKLVAQGSLAELRAATAARLHVDTADTALAADVLGGSGDGAVGRRRRAGRRRPGRPPARGAVPGARAGRCRRARAHRRATEPGGHVRRADRGGLRCCAVSSSRSSGAGGCGPSSPCSASFPIVIMLVLRFAGGPERGGGPTFLGQVTNNGVFAALAGLTITLPIFLPMAVSIVSGDSIAGEASLGTLRYLLVRPVGSEPPARRESDHGRRLLHRRHRRRRGRAV